MKKISYLITLFIAVALFALAGCQSPSASSPKQPDDPKYKPIEKREPVFTGEYYLLKEVDTLPNPVGFRAAPVYPVEFKRNSITGEAVVSFILTTKGKPQQLQVTQASHAGFADAAMKAVEQWQFKPAIKDGKSVNCVLSIPIAFNLNR